MKARYYLEIVCTQCMRENNTWIEEGEKIVTDEPTIHYCEHCQAHTRHTVKNVWLQHELFGTDG